jgi:alpha-L-arabinofuranosidase
MEPLGDTDGSVEAAWDYDTDDWREDLVAATKSLGPDVIRWGGNFIRYYRWREGVGPVRERPSMYNYLWGGKETNRVGTHEFVDFCRRVDAEPLMCVNFMSDGRRQYWDTIHGENRRGDVQEAADWVSYANDPDDRERKSHGVSKPYDIKLWQIGNETSYGADGFDANETAARTTEFAKAMRERDPSIDLIGWGDRGPAGDYGGPTVLDRAGEHLDYIAMHMMGMGPREENTVLRGFEYQLHPERAWEELIGLTDAVERRVQEMREVVEGSPSKTKLAITEGHVSFDPHNANPVLQEWLSAVYHARSMNIYQRNGDVVKMCTGADFCGTRWTVNAIRMPVPRWGDDSYLLPIGTIMRLFNEHNGEHGVSLNSAPSDLDIAASRTGDTVYLHVVNMNYNDAVEVNLSVAGQSVTGGTVYEIAPDHPREYVNRKRPNIFEPEKKDLEPGGPPTWRFPERSVSVVQLNLED